MKAYLLSFALGMPFLAAAQQFQSKTIKIETDEYKGEVSVCVDCAGIKPEPSKEYFWLEGNVVQSGVGMLKGKPLHGEAKLYTEGLEGEKQLIMEGHFFAGLKDGIVKNYVFGELDTEEHYEKGELKRINYYFPGKEGVDKRVEYLGREGQQWKVLFTFFSTRTQIQAEGYRKPVGESFNEFFHGAYKKILTDSTGKSYTKEEGRYDMNRRVGEWKEYYPNNNAYCVRIYDYDLLKKETFFTASGQPFSGVIEDRNASLSRVYARIEVKDGSRNGKTEDSYRSGNPSRTLVFAQGTLKEGGEALESFLAQNPVQKEKQLSFQCDQRGGGLYVDKIQYTPKGALVYFHYQNITLHNGAIVYTPPPGAKNAFTAYDIASAAQFPVKKVFGIPTEPAYVPLAYGEMIPFVLYFEGLKETHRFISLIEGDPENPYIIDDNGNTTYNWGCYELSIR
ncbi:antitoxin component YwqK of YwqJK toxin-antitoxin module [Thermonema lapsum]|uniref:Antitoxin component YwqK of YwqJK toxin-antitoxin module n=1 Tax=Thermonema lapsum TaxID=28195 RepID=A0A846MPF0_9BACT|nr:hypothetical protein [Thermonema lapsum]NIK73433.1 antitoxin component YwqK of YwqJK toxin-antitoxin module [Thermonema lapsum]